MLYSFRRHIRTLRFANICTLCISAVCFASVLFACSKTEGRSLQEAQNLTRVSSWASEKKSKPKTQNPPALQNLSKKDFPVAGTVSHHFLADYCIDSWFKALASKRKVKTFFIVSPSHFGLSTQKYSLDECVWDCGEWGDVYSDSELTKEAASLLEVEYDKNVFYPEHGVSTLTPYIAKYFPNAKVCAIAVNGEPPVNMKDAKKLTEVLAPFFTKEKQKENFLLISTDFSHHGNTEQTERKDLKSAQFMAAPQPQDWILCSCDNRPGIYAMAHLFAKDTGRQKKISVLYHTNSFELSGKDEDDITSYFFTFMY